MRPIRLGLIAGVMAMAWFMASDGALGQDKKEPGKAKGQLPAGWRALDLSAGQKDEVYKIQTEFRGKIDKLEDEIKKLKAEQSRKLADVLTPEQKKKLIEAIEGGKKEAPKKEAPKQE